MLRNRFVLSLFIPTTLLLFSCSQNEKTDGEGVDIKEFGNPSAQWRSVPFWALNDVLEPGEIKRQLAAFTEGGFGGAYLHSRTGLLTEYLGEEWWQAMDAGVQACEELGIECWFYDEDKWPSGFAGGIVPLASEEFRARAFLRIPQHKELPEHAEILSEDQSYRYVCARVPMGNPWFNGTSWVDLLNPETVKAFLDCSYSPYAERYKDKIGTVVQGIFTDEPQFSPRKTLPVSDGAVPYSPIIRQDFLEQHGYDFVDRAACLFEDAEGFEQVRLHYFQTLARRFEQSFSKQIADYCKKTGMIWTGHYNGENNFRSVQSNVGNMMIQYRHMQRPGIDKLGLHIGDMTDVHMMRSLSSVANQYGRTRRLSEMFGISGQNMNFEDRKWIADANAVLGVNHICPHLSLYSMKGCRKRDFPPTLSPQQPYWPDNKLVEDHMARVSYMSSVGSYAAEFLLLHPLESSFVDYRNGNGPGDLEEGNIRFGEFSSIMDHLQQNHRDYDFGDEQILADTGIVEGQSLRVGEMSYPAVILPPMRTIRASTLALLTALDAAGGKVIAIGPLPGLVDGRTDSVRLKELASVVISIELHELESFLAPAVRVTGPGSDKIWTMRRSVGEGQLTMLFNLSRKQTARVSFQLAGGMDNPMLWDPADGRQLKMVPSSDGTLELELAPAQSLFISTGSPSAKALPEDNYRIPSPASPVMNLTGTWKGTRKDPNAITLDFASYSLDGGASFSASEPVLGIYQRYEGQGLNAPMQLAFEVNVQALPSGCDLVVEQPEMYSRISINGREVDFAGNDIYRDIAFRRSGVASLLKEGLNTILMELDFVAAIPESLDARERYGTEIESIYLVGDFGVAAEVSPDPPAATQRNTMDILIPRPIHRFRSFTMVEEQTEFKGDLAPEGYPFYAGGFLLEQTFNFPGKIADKQYDLVFPEAEAVVIHVELNGKVLPPLAWSPWQVDITEALQEGDNNLRITLVSSLRNLLGPHHHRDGELIRVGPASFTGKPTWTGGGPGDEEWYDVRLSREPLIWRDDYHCIPFGFLSEPKIVSRSEEKTNL
ncbi:MAG: hypothetical protein GY790_24535 [Bacteroidetes bacterium]|nr:hypothetical protein [Bacteroidota bacterium]